MRVLVTGATGHVGTNLVHRLLAEGHEVRVLLHGAPLLLRDLPVEFVPGDVRDPRAVRRAVDGVDVVVHGAAVIALNDAQETFLRSVNVDGTRVVASAALGAGARMVHLSSVHAYHTNQLGRPLDESGAYALGADEPCYDRSKAHAEIEVRRLVERGLNATILNPVGIIGPYDHQPSLAGHGILEVAYGGVPVTTTGGFPFVHVDDVCDAIVAAFTAGAPGENHLLSGEYTAMRDMFHLVRTLVGRSTACLALPTQALRVFSPLAPYLAKWNGSAHGIQRDALYALGTELHVDTSKAQRVLGVQPRSVREAVQDALAWWQTRAADDALHAAA